MPTDRLDSERIPAGKRGSSGSCPKRWQSGRPSNPCKTCSPQRSTTSRLCKVGRPLDPHTALERGQGDKETGAVESLSRMHTQTKAKSHKTKHTSANVPIGQSIQESCPVALTYFPASQGLQKDCPSALLAVPAAQGLQIEKPVVGAYLPTPHD